MFFCLYTGCVTNKNHINKTVLSFNCRWTNRACIQVKPEMAPTQDWVVIVEVEANTLLKA